MAGGRASTSRCRNPLANLALPDADAILGLHVHAVAGLHAEGRVEALSAGAQVLGVLPRSLSSVEVAHAGLTELVLVDGLHARKARMTAESDAFAALPGGFGTLDELFEALTWAQLGLHTRPLGLLNVDGFWDPLVATIDRQVAQGFVTPSDRERLTVESTPDALLDALGAPGGADPVA